MKNDEIANLKDSIENTIDNIPETMQAEYEAYLTNELKDIALDLLLIYGRYHVLQFRSVL